MKIITIKSIIHLPIGIYLKIGSSYDWEEELDWNIVKVVEKHYTDIIVKCFASKKEESNRINAYETYYTYDQEVNFSDIKIVRKFIPKDAPKIKNWKWISKKFKKKFFSP